MVMLTSKLPFSQWTAIFKDPMTTAAAIDRLVHHSVIVELNVPSYRAESAKRTRGGAPPKEGEREASVGRGGGLRARRSPPLRPASLRSARPPPRQGLPREGGEF